VAPETPRGGARRHLLLYPLLFALAPALWIASRSAGQYRSADLAVVLGAVALLTGLALALALAIVRLLDRSDRATPLAAALVMLAVGWCFYYFPVQDAVSGISRRVSRAPVLVPLGALLTLAAIVWLPRQPAGRLLTLSAFMLRFGVLLVGLVALQVIASGGQPSQARRSRLVRELAAPIPTRAVPPGRNTPPRDIYLLVLDGHANARVLEEVFGFDNSPFENRLRELGFLVPRTVRSNYAQTYLSVSSLLNAAHVTTLAEDAGVRSKDHSLPTYLVRHNRVARFLKERGYRYLLFPSAWWAATATSPLADLEFDPYRGFELAREVRRTELRLAVLRSSLLRRVFEADPAPLPLVDHFLRSFEGLRGVAEDPAPTFTFAHVLLPHVPYVLDQQCRPLAREIPDYMEADTPEQRVHYIAQVRCVDRMVLDLVTALLRQSSTPPVILVVGDHGPRFADVHFYAHPERVSRAFVRERFGAFGAFYLPAGGDSAFAEPVTLVNVLGNVLRYYFGAELAPASDDVYLSGEEPYRFYPVDPRSLDHADPQAVRATDRAARR
jgi:hypothetical protein